jgi:hypothetical protein
MLRVLLAELFPKWPKRQALRERSTNDGSLSALASLQRKIKMADKQMSGVKNPEAPGLRSAKAHPDRKDKPGASTAPKTSEAPPRDVRDDPAPNPNGKPATGA